ncbi:MAG: pantoate--beta-alanine ligase [Candidatus Omnitrophota bacterium]|jgi:pantoate--beta-alanine ligase|nr:MAG: pantoate--beta-alanine ligase [Candidatus Omnitrophota bacterium]
MKIIKKINEMQTMALGFRRQGKSVGFVPTMGALHAGHLSLIRRARTDNDIVVVSIFINPAQFGRGEDYKRYPRKLRQDYQLCKKAGVDFIFCPSPSSMYTQDYQTYVEVVRLSGPLCGRFRPGHFRGVATVVAKLFHIVEPTIAYFGLKDAQQALVVDRMMQDLNFPVRIKVLPIAREKDLLAMSSRNAYLNARQRKEAAILPEALLLAYKLVKQGERNASVVIRKMRGLIRRAKDAKVQYISIVDAKKLKQQKKIKGRILVALAVWFGKTRLIDNMLLSA